MVNLRAIVVGVGHLGKIHARIWHEMENVDLVAVVDPRAEAAEEIGQKYNCAHGADLTPFLDQCDVASVVVPTKFHADVAKELIDHGVHVLVEKPMTPTLAEAEALVAYAKDKNVKLQPGYVERFNPAVMAVGRYIKQPRYIESVRVSPFPFRSLDIGVIKDVLIHDLDIVLSLAGAPVESVVASGACILTPYEDIVNARITFENGCVANMTASRVATKTQRQVRLFQDDAYFSIDYGKQFATIFRKTEEFAAGELSIEGLDLSKVLTGEVKVDDFIIQEQVAMESHEPLVKELESFRDAVLGKAPQIVSAQDAIDAQGAAEAIMQAVDEHLQRIGKTVH